MFIYLAGGVTGNLRELWKKLSKDMKVFLAGSGLRLDWIMEIYLAGDNGKKKLLQDLALVSKDALQKINILESYYYLRKNDEFMSLVPLFNSFLLDSGAFTFMSGTHKEDIDWDEYTEQYAEFINKWNIELFFELDIDSIVGLEEVERLRKKLEDLTGRKPIPVWHKSRGRDYFIKMCKEYPYVAIGGIVTQEIPRNVYEKYFPWFIKIAHDNGAKIHGLGYTTISNLKKYHFDSVDSTSWLYGNRGGFLYKFVPSKGTMEKIEGKVGQRLKGREGAVHNFNEYVKMAIYADKYW